MRSVREPLDSVESDIVPWLMGWCVVLKHEMPDGSNHLDWFIDPIDEIAPAAPEVRRLLSFRVDRSPLEPGVDRVMATPTPPHRVHYLSGEGLVQGGRLGHVVRLGRAWALLRTTGSTNHTTVDLLSEPHGTVFASWTSATAIDGEHRHDLWVWSRL